MSKRVFLIVLDSVGIGEAPDADKFNSVGANTMRACYMDENFNMPNMKKLGLFNIDGMDYDGGVKEPEAAYCRMQERSMGKDTTTGHWEMAGIISPNPMPTYPDGFPDEILDEFKRQTGRGVLCNKPYSGTVVINDYGDEHVRTGDLIVYTSADSVFQIAAHEEVVPLETLYEYCRIARKILTGKHAVGRVIARPFIGKNGNYERTTNRHDFSLEPAGETILDAVKAAGKETIAVGKIYDIFAGKGITEYAYTHNNDEGIDRTLEYMDKDFEGLCFINLVDFDVLYGHRNNVPGYAKALSHFDERLPEITAKLKEEDILIITADHGNDPSTPSTDHDREYVPFILYGKCIEPVNYGTRSTFADLGATVLKYLNVKGNIAGKSVL